MALSYKTDIKPMFTPLDQDHMLNQQGMFDLWSYDDVKSNASAIYQAVQSGRMPPPGTEPRWDSEKVKKFKQWMDEGYPP
jgi:hypothetical protein